MSLWKRFTARVSTPIFRFQTVKDKVKAHKDRQIQEQLDVFNLFLYTSLHKHAQASNTLRVPGHIAKEVSAEAMRLDHETRSAAVQDALRSQILRLATATHACLQLARDPRAHAAAFRAAVTQPPQQPAPQHQQQQPARPRSGLAFAGMAPAAKEEQPAAASSSSKAAKQQKWQILLPRLASMTAEAVGFSLSVGPSTVPHEEAGSGLFVQGQVPAGTVVALFPGLVYPPPHHGYMHNYPKVDKDNPYLVARYDKCIIDSRPWGRGQVVAAADAEVQAALLQEQARRAQREATFSARLRKAVLQIPDAPAVAAPDIDAPWVLATTESAKYLGLLEGRNPYALAHFANHPGKGMASNTVVASFSLALNPEDLPELRAYLPNITFDPQGTNHRKLLQQQVVGVALVASRAIADGEEVLFNYRMSPALGRPAWYTAVDEQEEGRRWAF